jgi:hypothetical protein
VRYERSGPGELVHMHVMEFGRLPDGGWRVHGHTARETTWDRTAKVGFDHVHSAVDDYSRLASPISWVMSRAPAPASRPVPRPTSPPTAFPASSGS